MNGGECENLPDNTIRNDLGRILHGRTRRL